MLFSKSKPKSGIAIIRRYLRDIESALDDGYTREDIYLALCEKKGLQITFHSFITQLKRARQATAKGKKATKSTVEKIDLEQSKLDRSNSSNGGVHPAKPPEKSAESKPIGRKKFAPHPDFDPKKWDTRFK